MAFVPNLKKPVVCVVGPTASGKSDVAQRIALALDGEVVSADSMQVYRGMDIGTGKVLPEDRLVAHWGLDLVDPGNPYSAALFQDYARARFADIEARGRRCVLAGGTGLYIRAAIDAYDFPKGEQTLNPVRDKWTAFANEHGAQALWEKLRQVDADSAEVIHPNNVRRVVRAFELLEEGKTYAEQKRNLAILHQAVPTIQFGLAVDPDLLRARIDRRVDSMVESGLVGEVESLLAQGFREGITAPQAIGYKEMVEYLDGTTTLDDSIERIKIATHRYAKRQRSWFRKDQRIIWLDANSRDASSIAEEALRRMNEVETEQ